MDVDRFTQERAQGWEELAGLVREAGTRPQRLGAERLLRLGRRYRSAAADLALARRLFPGDPLTRTLERLVTDARQCVYASEARRRSVVDFITTGYWQRIRERPIALLAGIALLLVPLTLAAIWAIDDPAAALGVVPAQFQDAADPASGGAALTPGDEAELSSAIFTNNIRVTFVAIAGGILLGIGSAAVTIFNGGFVGALVGLDDRERPVRRPAAVRAPARAARAELHRGRLLGRAAARLVDDQPRQPDARRVAARGGAAGDGDRAGDDAVARGRRSDRGLREPAPSVAAGGARGRLRARRHVLDAGDRPRAARSRPASGLRPQVGGDAGGGELVGRRLDDLRAGVAEHVRDAGAGGQHVERDGLGADRVGARRLGGDDRVEVGIADGRDGHRVVAGEHRHRVGERLRRALVEQVAEDHHQRALGALDRLQRWSPIRVGLAVLLVLVALVVVPLTWNLLTPAHDLGIDGKPTCGTSNVMILMAQSVPSATSVPCVASLPAGWELGGVEVEDGRGRVLARLRPRREPRRRSDAAPARRVSVSRARARCRATKPGMRRFERIRATSARPAQHALLPVPGRLRHLRFAFDGRATASLIFDADSALAFQPRADARGEQCDEQNGLGSAAPVRPVPRRIVMAALMIAAYVLGSRARGSSVALVVAIAHDRVSLRLLGIRRGWGTALLAGVLGWGIGVLLALEPRRLGLGRRRPRRPHASRSRSRRRWPPR